MLGSSRLTSICENLTRCESVSTIASGSSRSLGSDGSDYDDFDFRSRSETLFFYDWDDTLFPTTDLTRWGIRVGESSVLTEEQTKKIGSWADALYDVLEEACRLSAGVFIVTNARSSWVELCIATFAPKVLDLFLEFGSGLRIVYARERFEELECRRSDSLWSSKAPSLIQDPVSAKEYSAYLTKAKYVAMKEEVDAFYSQYPGQTWKSIFSFGDMKYEYHAVKDVTFHRIEDVRTKAFLLPLEPFITEMTVQLRFHRAMLHTYACHDGDLDLDLCNAFDPMENIAMALEMPSIAKLDGLGHAWGREYTPADEDLDEALKTLDEVLLGHVL